MIERGVEVAGAAVENFLSLPEPNGGVESVVVLTLVFGTGVTKYFLDRRIKSSTDSTAKRKREDV
jgi:hypothetical protein